jgi:hypothetical protein
MIYQSALFFMRMIQMALKPNLIDAVQQSRNYDLRKQLPNFQQISELVPEDYVKLKCNSEYFWVKVDAVDNPCVGIVQDEPTFPQIFQKGDKIEFEYTNVFDLRSYEWLTNEGI